MLSFAVLSVLFAYIIIELAVRMYMHKYNMHAPACRLHIICPAMRTAATVARHLGGGHRTGFESERKNNTYAERHGTHRRRPKLITASTHAKLVQQMVRTVRLHSKANARNRNTAAREHSDTLGFESARREWERTTVRAGWGPDKRSSIIRAPAGEPATTHTTTSSSSSSSSRTKPPRHNIHEHWLKALARIMPKSSSIHHATR